MCDQNRFFFSVIEPLGLFALFDKIFVCFLLVSHTHENNEQTFSKISEWLCHNYAVTQKDLYTEIGYCYNNYTATDHLEKIIN